MIENEFKMMLTEEQYKKIFNAYCFNTINQTNNYYDTDDLQMSSRHITVRVRELDGRFFLQMKLPTNVNFSRVELSQELDGLPEKIGGDVLSALCKEKCPDVKRLGVLQTERSVWKFDGGEIDLDRSRYFSKTDFELEIEFTDENAAREILADITELIGEKVNADICMGKVRRFLEEYKRST